DVDPPHALKLINPIAHAMIVRPVKYLRRRRKNARRAQTTRPPPPADHGSDAVCDAAIVIVVLAVAAVGVTVAGAKVQLAPAGSPEQPKVTVPLNPPRAVSVMVSVLVDPRGTVS